MKKTHSFRRRFLIVLICLFGAYAACTVLPRPQNYAAENTMRRSSDMPILIAHGGGNREFPDNTLEAFYNAYSVDPRVMMETDVCITADGVVILSHDTTLDRKTNVTGSIAEWNYADLMAQRVNFGYTNPTSGGVLNGARRLFAYEGMNRSPLDVTYPEGVTARDEKVFLATTLEELITAFPENRINVEIKQSGETGMRALREVTGLDQPRDQCLQSHVIRACMRSSAGFGTAVRYRIRSCIRRRPAVRSFSMRCRCWVWTCSIRSRSAHCSCRRKSMISASPSRA